MPMKDSPPIGGGGGSTADLLPVTFVTVGVKSIGDGVDVVVVGLSSFLFRLVAAPPSSQANG